MDVGTGALVLDCAVDAVKTGELKEVRLLQMDRIFVSIQGRPRIAKPRMMKENGAKKRTAHTGSFRQQTQRTRGDAKKTMLRNCLGYFKESMQS